MTYRRAVRSPRLAVAVLSLGALAAAAATVAAPAQAQTARTAHGWRIIKLIGAKNVFLNDMAAVSASDTWLGGSQDSSVASPELYQLSHGKLKTVVPPGGPEVFVDALSALSGDDVWGTEDNAATVLHLGRLGWSHHSLAIGSDDVLMAGVVAVSTKSVWVFDYDFTTKTNYFYHYNGKSWRRQVMPYNISANSDVGLVSGTANDNIWALSFYGAAETPAAIHYNGSKWLLTKFPGGLTPAGKTLFMRQIYAQSATSVWATAFVGSKTAEGPVVLLHWNGSRWSKVTGKLPAAALEGPMTSDGHGGLWLDASTTNGLGGLFLHYSGGHWTTYKAPTARASHQLVTIEDMALVPGTDTVLAVGAIGVGFLTDSGAAVLEYTP